MLIESNSVREIEVNSSADSLIVSEPAKGRIINQIGGSFELATIYNQAIAMMRDLELFHVTRQETVDGVVLTFLCNYWRIDRHDDGSVVCFTLNLKSRKWVKVQNFEHWPSIPVWPLNRTNSGNTWKMLYTYVFWDVMRHKGFDAYEKTEPKLFKQLKLKIMNEVRKENKVGPIKALPKKIDEWMEYEIKDRMPYLPSQKLEALFNHQFINYRYDKFDGARYALVKHVFNGVIEKSLFRKILCTHWNSLSLRQYLAYASHRDSVLRIISERKSLFPLLWRIPHESWGNPSCMSRQNLASTTESLSPVGYKWLHDTSVVVTSSKHVCENLQIANLLGLIKVDDKIPVALWYKLLQIDRRLRQRIENMNAHVDLPERQMIRLFELYAKQALDVRKTHGYKAFKGFLAEARDTQNIEQHRCEITEILDFLIFQGFKAGFPHKNSTWNSISRQSMVWHDELEKKRLGEDFSWSDPYFEALQYPVNKIQIKPLLSKYELFEEGQAMHHCIVTYADECSDGQYRVFSLTTVNDETNRSTLGLYRDGKCWKIDQHKTYCNQAVSHAHADLGKEICKVYNQRMKR